MPRAQKITFGELRASRIRDVLIYCADYRCTHHVKVSGDRWGDDVRLSDIEPGFVCTASANAALMSGRIFRTGKRGFILDRP
jgi:hypothetical protein